MYYPSRKYAATFFVAALLALLGVLFSMGATAPTCTGTTVTPSNIVSVVNNDPAATPTTFCASAGTYNLTQTLVLNDGDQLIGPKGNFADMGRAHYGTDQTALIRNGANLPNLIHANGTVKVLWLDLAGAQGKYAETGSPCPQQNVSGTVCPVNGTGNAISAGQASSDSVFRVLKIHDNDSSGIGNIHGSIRASELYSNTLDSGFIGFNGAGVKGVNEYEAINDYDHNEQGNGFWCDQGCHPVDSSLMPNGFWVHDNYVANDARSGARYEFSPMPQDVGTETPTALIDSNDFDNAKVTMADAQNGTISNNVFTNMSGQASIIFSDSGRTDRTDLKNGNATGNTLNGSHIVGCSLTVVTCTNNF